MLPAVRVAAELHRSHSSDALLTKHYGRVVGKACTGWKRNFLVRMVGSILPSVRAKVIAVKSLRGTVQQYCIAV